MDINFPKNEQTIYFDDSVLSCGVHLVKPNRKIYELAASRLGVAVEECVFIDDSQKNIDGAEAIGMTGILYRDYDSFMTDIKEIIDNK